MGKYNKTFIISIIATMLNALSLCANTLSLTPTKTDLDSTLEVSLITCGPGKIIYELEGHTGLRFKSDSRDFIVNWGLFDFDSPNFLYRFVKGETDYMAGASPTEMFLNAYKLAGRNITEQKLNLTAAEANQALKLVEENLLPENRVYRYNYVKDNCATRPLRLIEKAIGDSITLGPNPLEGRNTFREIMESYHRDYPWYQFGIDLALGSGIDYQLDNREAAFAPVSLEKMLVDSKAGKGENSRNIVYSTKILNEGTPEAASYGPTPFYFTPLFVCWVVFFIVAFITWIDIFRRKTSKWLDCMLFSIFGLAGCLITFLVFISEHEATTPNALIFWLNPFCLLVPILIWFKRCTNFLVCYQFANFACLIAMGIIMISIGQKTNPAFIPLILCDAIRALSFIYIAQCKKRKGRNIYRNTSSGYYYSH